MDFVNSTDLPSNVIDPGRVENVPGALKLYGGAVQSYVNAFDAFSRGTGLFTDELVSGNHFSSYVSNFDDLDGRNIGEEYDNYFLAVLYKVRADAREARIALQRYAPRTPTDMQGYLLAIEGLAEVWLAEWGCSGVPLSHLNFDGGYTLTRGYSTTEIYLHAITLFDSALRLAKDSVRIINFARVGRGRAFLALNDLANAKAAVADVPTDFLDRIELEKGRKRQNVPLGYSSVQPIITGESWIFLGDREGLNGLPFGSQEDPRTELPSLHDSLAPIIVRSGVNARLIDAEAALVAGDADWLIILNRLRTTCSTIESCPTPAPAGVGGVPGLPPLADPAGGASMQDSAAREKRISLLFDERGYWLLLTGHRQGDLRRLVRNYKRSQNTVYPVGLWAAYTMYGSDVNVMLPSLEREKNNLYTGCVNRDA